MVPNVAGSSPVIRPSFILEQLQDLVFGKEKAPAMSWYEALLLGLIQGVTEFFPISSSGHLQLFQHILGMTHLDSCIPFNLVCHLGTLLSILCVFSKQMKRLILLKWKQILFAILPLFPLLLFLKPVKQLFDSPEYLGICFLITATLLYIGERFSKVKPSLELKQKRHLDAFCIGISQAIAILPGISRSGTTITCARLMGWKEKDAAAFSFLLAIPTILGGIFIESLQLLMSAPSSISFNSYFIGFFTSFIVGYFALILMINLIKRKKIMGFVWYCVIVGIISMICFS